MDHKHSVKMGLHGIAISMVLHGSHSKKMSYHKYLHYQNGFQLDWLQSLKHFYSIMCPSASLFHILVASLILMALNIISELKHWVGAKSTRDPFC